MNPELQKQITLLIQLNVLRDIELLSLKGVALNKAIETLEAEYKRK